MMKPRQTTDADRDLVAQLRERLTEHEPADQQVRPGHRGDLTRRPAEPEAAEDA